MEGRILLIEDDSDLGSELEWLLKRSGFEVDWVCDGMGALEICQHTYFDLLLVDIQLPSINGFEVVRQLKLLYKDLRFLFLTARNTKESCIQGLKLGADDYIVKPFDTEELVWRMNNILARGHSRKIAVLEVGDVLLNKATMELRVGEQTVQRLTGREFEVWKFLLENTERILSREEMLNTLWGENDYFMGRSLDVFISKIRKTLLKSKKVKIETVYKVGFIMRVHLKS
ncbi:response regulator transcription factor [Sphingobacterium sp.]|jgi:DNA-binding response OmpR family regulator|uniref:response regulator transcription factor n=1 Tax=Sphingobacterium sp. TaxID=341027 RepID=UPI0028A0DCA8|nr:response regulator transcription factor [Sphingobacterium sp.]